MQRAMHQMDGAFDHAMDYVLGEDDDSSENSAFDKDGNFIVLDSFDQTKGTGSSKRKKKATQKQVFDNKEEMAGNKDVGIATVSSVDSEIFKDTSCGGRIGDYFGWNPDNIVVKILVS